MAGEINFDVVANASANIGVVVLWILIAGVVFSGILFIIWWYSHKVIFVIRKVTGDRPLARIDRAKVYMRRGQPIRWRLRSTKAFVPVPPKEAIDVTEKGKLFVEAYLTEDGEYHYITDKMEGQIGSLHPVKSVDKEFYAQQVEEGKKYAESNFKDLLLASAPYLLMVLILVIFMIFFNETVAPTIQLGHSLDSATTTLSRAIETWNGCSQNLGVVPN